MIITYLRSSSYNCHTLCAHKFFFEYCLFIRPPSGKKADKGTIVHKSLETLARVKKATQDGVTFYIDEAFGKVEITEVTPEWATRKAYDYYTTGAPRHNWYPSDLRDCIEWTQKAISINNGLFDPRNRTIIAPEQYFDITIDKPWAHYDYYIGDQHIKGQLSLKGTIDLIVADNHQPGLIEIIDYKTGLRKDWTKDGPEKKTYAELRYDPQLCLYHYAASQLFPQAEEIFVTILFINDGGPFTLCFDKADLEFTENIICKKFEEIRDTQIPRLNVTWRCQKICPFGRTKSQEDPNKTMCEFYRDKIRDNGIEKTMLEFGKSDSYNNYQEGGGRKHHV